VRKLSGKVHIY